MKKHLLITLLGLSALAACKKDGTDPGITDPPVNASSGVYVLNEGNMGQNTSTVDYLNYKDGSYNAGVYAKANTGTGALGDTGNDIAIYGSKMYILLNGSNKIEVVNAKTLKRLAVIQLTSPRFITFYKGKVYATAYGGVKPDSPYGQVCEIDTAQLTISRSTPVGRQPEGVAVINDNVYVANSGGYTAKNYERTISVVPVSTFTEDSRIDVAINLKYLLADSKGQLWVTSLGNYYDIPANLYCVNPKEGKIIKTFNLAVSNMTLAGNQLYTVIAPYGGTNQYIKIATETLLPAEKQYVSAAANSQIKTPYGIAVDVTRDIIYIADAANYTSTGKVEAIDITTGETKSSHNAGSLPAHFAIMP